MRHTKRTGTPDGGHGVMSETVVSVSLAHEIVEAHEAAIAAGRTALEHAHRAGELLMQARAQCEHGAWLPWLAEHCPTIPERTARAYMQIDRRWDELEAAMGDRQRVADLPVRQALALLAAPREIPVGGEGEIDWPACTAEMEAAWDDLDIALDALSVRRAKTADPYDPYHAIDVIREAEALETRAAALKKSEIYDLRRLTRELAAMLDLPVEHMRPLTQPDQGEAFLARCRVRIAELQAS